MPSSALPSPLSIKDMPVAYQLDISKANSYTSLEMRVSKAKVSQEDNRELFGRLHQTLADLKSPQEVEEFLKIFLVEAEHIMLAKRLNIAYLLDKKTKYRSIINTLKVSPATIALIQQKLKTQGAQIALQKIRAEEWASQWGKKIRKFVKVV